MDASCHVTVTVPYCPACGRKTHGATCAEGHEPTPVVGAPIGGYWEPYSDPLEGLYDAPAQGE